MVEQAHILVVDDDPEIRSLLAHFLGEHGYSVSEAEDGHAMFLAIEDRRPDLVVLDLMMPGEDGLVLCRRLADGEAVPVIMLTAVAEEADKIVGLEMGADDYLTKPFNPRELLARIRAVLRRVEAPRAREAGNNLVFEDWVLDLGRHELKRDGETLIPLSTGEFRLLQILAEHPQQVLSRDFLLDRIHGREGGPFDRSVDIQLSRLRRKLDDDPRDPAIIKTIRGGGYMFNLPVSRRS